ncbi:MAG: hypothetical protein GY707_05220 [Desulfobacteraceae bacterium]|nr:hypothetical protein [Desulfobacteraceae bacterium]
MSGNQIGSVIGAAVGFILAPTTGGASLTWAMRGMSIGGMIGGLLMPDEVGIQDQHGPRLSDLKATSSTYGAAINRVYGAYRVGGNMIYSSDIKETKHVREEEVGKGGSETYDVISYSYAVDMAIAFCEGPVQSIKRIWADSVLIYDMSVGGTTSAYQASEEESGGFEIYKGTSNQPSDWFLESINPDTPAYRGVCYIRFQDFQLEKYGNRIPNITAEIVKEGLYEHVAMEKGGYNYIDELKDISGYSQQNTNIGPNLNNSKYFYLTQSKHNNLGSTGDFIIGKFYDKGIIDHKFFNHGISGNTHSPSTTGDGILAGFGNNNTFTKFYLFDSSLKIDKTWDIYSSGDPQWFSPSFAGYSEDILVVACRDKYASTDSSLYNYIITSDTWGDVGSGGARDPRINKFIYGQDLHDLHSNSIFAIGYSCICVFSYSQSSPLGSVVRVWDLHTGVLKGTVDCNTILGTNHFGQSPIGMKVIKGKILYSVYNSFNSRSHYILKIDLEKLSIISHDKVSDGDNYDGTYTFGSFYKGVFTIATRTNGFCKIREKPGVKSSQVTISSICQELMISTGISINEMSFLDTESLYVNGFFIDKVGSIRSAISILQTAFLFDVIEDDFKITTQTRGSVSAKTIDEFIYDNGVKIEHAKSLLTELPRKVTFKYSNKYRDYLTSSQSSLRVDSVSSNSNTVELPIVLSDTEAKRLAEIYLFNSWASKDTFLFSIDFHNNSSLKIGSSITLSFDGTSYLTRLIEITKENSILKCKAVLEANYISNATGQDTSEGFLGSSLSLADESSLKIFDSPTLDNSLINSFGLYYAITSDDPVWRGASIFKSKDSGATYSSIGSTLIKSSIGLTRTSLGSGPSTIIDFGSSVQIHTRNNKFKNISYEDLLNGNNYVKIGNEILQYMEFTEDGNDLYTISTFLRGRRGTEWAIENHSINEDFVLLNFEDILFSFSTLNTSRKYKAVTFGSYIDDASEEEVTYQGTNLKPFSPINLTDKYSIDNSLSIDWMRRDRYISGYMRSLPLSEDYELYNLYIYSKDSILLREELSITPPYVYTSLKRTEDGLYGTKDDIFNFEISQISDQVGEGYRLKDSKAHEHKKEKYFESFTGANNSSPQYSFYSLYENNIQTYTQEILDNSLRLYVQSSTQYGGVGIKFNNPIIGDFDISFDFNVFAEVNGSSLVFFAGSVAIYVWRDSNKQIRYYDYDSGVIRSISRVNSYGSIRIRSINGVIEYMWKDGSSSTWEVAVQKIYTLNCYGFIPHISTYEHLSIYGSYEYLIDNLEANY